LLFGPALVEAHELESEHAVHPRIILGERAVDAQHKALNYYADPRESPQNALLICDDDGFTCVNYLALLFDEPEDPRDDLALHRDVVVARLQQHRANRRQWEKYRWVAEYHNTICGQVFPNEPNLLVPSAEATWSFRQFVDR